MEATPCAKYPCSYAAEFSGFGCNVRCPGYVEVVA
jgi:hypothetical protein